MESVKNGIATALRIAAAIQPGGGAELPPGMKAGPCNILLLAVLFAMFIPGLNQGLRLVGAAQSRMDKALLVDGRGRGTWRWARFR